MSSADATALQGLNLLTNAPLETIGVVAGGDLAMTIAGCRLRAADLSRSVVAMADARPRANPKSEVTDLKEDCYFGGGLISHHAFSWNRRKPLLTVT